MRSTICMTAALALCACSKPAPPADNMADANVAVVDNLAVANSAVTPASAVADFKETSWEFTYDGKPMFESIDADGKYIAESGGKHADHGTAVVKDSKLCFTSAMNHEGEDCWTDPKIKIGQSGESVSDKGEKITLKRVAYKPLTMPAG